MSKNASPLETLRYTSQLRHFIRAQIKWALSGKGADGTVWKLKTIERDVKNGYEAGDAPTLISDDTIKAFIDEDAYTPERNAPKRVVGREAVIALAWFVVATGFARFEELEAYDQASSPGLAKLLAAYFPQAFLGTASIGQRLVGDYVDYRWSGRSTLQETRVEVTSPDNGESWTVAVTHTQHSVRDADFIRQTTADLDPRKYDALPARLAEDESFRASQFVQTGVMIWTADVIIALLTATPAAPDRVMVGQDVIYGEDAVTAFRLAAPLAYARDAAAGIKAAPPSAPNPAFGYDFGLYNISAKIDTKLEDVYSQFDLKKNNNLGFFSGKTGDMSKREFELIAAEERETEIETAMIDCTDATGRLALAIDYGRSSYGVEAVAEGADVNADHPRLGLPMIHAMAARGMRPLIAATLATGRCDLTKRDAKGMLAHVYAEVSAGDAELADQLIAVQAAQFEAQGLDPRVVVPA